MIGNSRVLGDSLESIDTIAPLASGPQRRRSHAVRSANAVRFGLAAASRRAMDIGLAGTALIALLPIAAVRAILAQRREGRVFQQVPAVGYHRRPFAILRFAGGGALGWWPTLLNVLRGEMAIAGPRALAPAEAAAIALTHAERWDCRPGLISLHTVRGRVGVAHVEEGATDREFYYRESLAVNAGLLARAVASAPFAARSSEAPPDRLTLLGVEVANFTMREAVDWIVAAARGTSSSMVAFVNPDCLNLGYTNSEYRATLANAQLVLPDGIGLKYGCRMLGTAMKANVNGTDLFPELCDRLKDEPLSLFLLGGRPGIAAAAADEMTRRYPGVRVAGTHHGYYTPEQEPGVLAEINGSGASILLVGFGAPRQELWLARQAAELTPPVRLGVGGLFDYYSGRIPRAPAWMRETGLEWVWRLMQEPGRLWRRYLVGNPLFLYRVWKQSRQEAS